MVPSVAAENIPLQIPQPSLVGFIQRINGLSLMRFSMLSASYGFAWRSRWVIAVLPDDLDRAAGAAWRDLADRSERESARAEGAARDCFLPVADVTLPTLGHVRLTE